MRRHWCTSRILLALVVVCSSVLSLSAFPPAHAAVIPNKDFSLEVSPSPLVADIKPGQSKQLELKIRNASAQAEQLRIQTRAFSIAHPSEQITITNSTPADLAQWVNFSNPTFSVGAGQWFTEKITIKLPDSAGFSYPFVIVISRANDPTTTDGGASIRGSIAVFTLINIDRPGATRKLAIESFKLDQNFYEYLPATFNIKLKNTGNTIVQPYGNIYIQSPGKESTPLAVLPVNATSSYILPGSTKNVSSSWSDGFPYYKTSSPGADGQRNRTLIWNWENIAHFRFGHYTAKIVAVYNDGTRDVPVVQEISFWVIPWRIMLGALVVLVIIGFGVWTILKRFTHHATKIVNSRKNR